MPSLALIAPLCVLGALIGTELVATLGVAANTALLGALAGMGLARLPGAAFAPYRSAHMQNLAQGAMSAATFGAGNALLLPLGIPFVLGRPDLVGPMFAGVFLAVLVDGWLLYRLFGTPAFPAEAAWPPGAAVGATIAADRRGWGGAGLLLAGAALGGFGAMYRAPMAAFGVAFLGAPWTLGVFGLGLVVRGHSEAVFGWLLPGADLMRAHVPHGLMIGAALVALGQMASRGPAWGAGGAGRVLGKGALAYLAIAMVLALAGGMAGAMPVPLLMGFVAFAGLAALLHGLVVALAAMHVGWLPSFAVALVMLLIGMAIGFPQAALCLLVGFAAATGSAGAAIGYALKAGHMLRGADPVFEQARRRQQFQAALFAFAVAGAVVWLTHDLYFAAGRVPPVDRVYVATIRAGLSAEAAWQMAGWAVPGAVLQALGGPRRQLGVLLATGLLMLNPLAGWAVLAGLLLRAVLVRRGVAAVDLQMFGAGVIAGDALVGFVDAVGRVAGRR